VSRGSGGHWEHALLLSSQAFREKDRIVRLLTLEHGKISVLAIAAAVSQKRFPPALLEGFNLLKVNLQPPRNMESHSESTLWILNGAELKQSYDHFRVGYREIEWGVFPLKMVTDLVPDGPVDPVLFKSLGRYLRDSAVLDLGKIGWWLPLAFWTWFGHFQGFGDLTQDLEQMKSADESLFWEHWHDSLARSEADFLKLFKGFSGVKAPPISMDVMRVIYQRWLELSGMQWKHFEAMIS
jgi:hypothetical protein